MQSFFFVWPAEPANPAPLKKVAFPPPEGNNSTGKALLQRGV